jgi:F-type H+-transporting ATPase subunit epsilon
MAGKIVIQLVTPNGVILDKQVDEVIAPGVMGEFGVLIGHTPMLTFIKPGIFSYLDEDRFTKIVVGSGFCEVLKDRVTVLVDLAYRAEEIDPSEAAEELDQIQRELEAVDSGAEPEKFRSLSNRLQVARSKVALTGGS